MVYLYRLGQSSPHVLTFGVELDSNAISLHGTRARSIRGLTSGLCSSWASGSEGGCSSGSKSHIGRGLDRWSAYMDLDNPPPHELAFGVKLGSGVISL